MKLSHNQIKEIAEHLELGMRCLVNKETGEIADLLDWDDIYYDPIEEEEERRQKILAEWSDYVDVEKPSSRESFRFMASFVEEIPEGEIRTRLVNALNGRKPFRSFKDQLYFDEGIRQKWFEHRAQALIEYVIDFLHPDFELEDTPQSSAREQ